MLQTTRGAQVYYKATTLSLRDSAGRIEFVRHLYNRLCVESDPTEAEDTQSAVSGLNEQIERLPMKSMYTKDDKNDRNRSRGDDGNHTGTGEGVEMTAHSSEHIAMRWNRTLLWIPVAANGGHFST